MSASVAALVAPRFGPVGGLLAGIGSSTLLGLAHWLFTQFYRIDHVISGMAVNAFAAGGTNFLFGRFADPSQTGSVPHVPLVFFDLIAFGAAFLVWAYVRQTRGGLWLLAVGSDPDKARLMGLAPTKVRLLGLLATGVFTGLAGAQLIAYTGNFTNDMTAGRGYIALAALIIGGWRPIPSLIAALAFGFFSALRLQLQGTMLLGAQVPSEIWSTLPYLVTLVALGGFLSKNRTPAGLGKF